MMMTLVDDELGISDDELVRMFEDCTLAADDFDHRRHVRLGWIYLRRHRFLQAVTRFRSGLYRFAHRHGVPDKVHETITWMYMLLIADRMIGDAGRSWAAFVRGNPDLLGSGRRLLLHHYCPETLASEQAKTTFVMPDRSPFAAVDTTGIGCGQPS